MMREWARVYHFSSFSFETFHSSNSNKVYDYAAFILLIWLCLLKCNKTRLWYHKKFTMIKNIVIGLIHSRFCSKQLQKVFPSKFNRLNNFFKYFSNWRKTSLKNDHNKFGDDKEISPKTHKFYIAKLRLTQFECSLKIIGLNSSEFSTILLLD